MSPEDLKKLDKSSCANDNRNNKPIYKVRKIRFFLLIIFLAIIISIENNTPALEDQLVYLSLKQVLGPAASFAAHEPLEIKALLLDYSENEELLLKARVALLKYPEMSRKVFILYGDFSEFQEILLRYGEPIIPIIHYFMQNEFWFKKICDLPRDIINYFLDFFRPSDKSETEKNYTINISEEQKRGLYAISYIKEEGHHFLGQFVVTKNKEVKWILTDRIIQNLINFFFSGTRNLEAKWVSEQQLAVEDFLDAGLDVMAMGGTFKLVKMAKKLEGFSQLRSFPQKISLLGSKLLPRGTTLRDMIKYGGVITAGYLMLKHPSLISSVFAWVAQLLDLPPFLFQVVCWTFLFLILFYPVFWLIKLLMPPARWIFKLFFRKVEMAAA